MGVPNTECPTLELSAKFETETYTTLSVVDNCVVAPDTPTTAPLSGKSKGTAHTSPVKTAQSLHKSKPSTTAPNTLEKTPFVTETLPTIQPTKQPSGLNPLKIDPVIFSPPLMIETESSTDTMVPYNTSKTKTQSATDGDSTEIKHSKDASNTPCDKQSSKVASTSSDIKALLYPSGTDAAALETAGSETAAHDTNAFDNNAPEIEVTISTLDNRRLLRKYG
ncbi:unnamed protein product [Peronospora belbahrii]|uniref:Uncharacterized protein n=1 Tax=Peronospora belbahrii TaxID=622444 RepID=A0AAU9L7R9_9STRA|nr:unnamed protein product [Peronospora belbahrii]